MPLFTILRSIQGRWKVLKLSGTKSQVREMFLDIFWVKLMITSEEWKFDQDLVGTGGNSRPLVPIRSGAPVHQSRF